MAWDFETDAEYQAQLDWADAFGTPEQKERYLRPLLGGEVFSCYSMTERW